MKKDILLSIRPKIVDEIINGTKKFEFRKKFPDITDEAISNKVFIYCSKPIMKIIGSFIVKSYNHTDFDTLMMLVNASDTYKKRISNYFIDKESCHAMEISNLTIYEFPLSLDYLRKEFPGFCPGQSYRYLTPEIKERIRSLNKEL